MSITNNSRLILIIAAAAAFLGAVLLTANLITPEPLAIAPELLGLAA